MTGKRIKLLDEVINHQNATNVVTNSKAKKGNIKINIKEAPEHHVDQINPPRKESPYSIMYAMTDRRYLHQHNDCRLNNLGSRPRFKLCTGSRGTGQNLFGLRE